jgi:hypothetical protein
MNTVRCSSCGRAGLPVVPGSLGGHGLIAHPVAHVKQANTLATLHPCLEGASLELLAACVEPGHPLEARTRELHEMIMSTDALWEL